MAKLVFNWPALLPVKSCRWFDGPGTITMESLTSGSIYAGGGKPRARVRISGTIINSDMLGSLMAYLADLKGGENLALIADFNRAAFTYDPYYLEPPAGIQGTVLWQSSAGTNYSWVDSSSVTHVWLAGLSRTGGGASGTNTITLGNGYPGAWVEFGHRILIGDRRYVVKQRARFSGAGTVNLTVAPYFEATISGSVRCVYPGEVGLFHLRSADVPELDQDGRGDWTLEFSEVFEAEYPEGLTYAV